MDPAAFAILNKVYALLSKKEDKITDKEMSYVIGQLESLLTFYSDLEGDLPEIKKKGFISKLGLD